MRQTQGYRIKILVLIMLLMLSGTYVCNNLTWQNLKLQVKLGIEFTKTYANWERFLWQQERKTKKEKYKEKDESRLLIMPAKKGLYANIHAKRKRIKAGSGETMRKPGSKGAPTAANFKKAAKTAKKKKK